MSDSELIAWLTSGGKTELPPEVEASRRHSDFARRLIDAMQPADDLAPTEELQEMEVARLVYAVHAELNALGDEDYSAVWLLLSAPHRRAIKAYVAMARKG